jgi:hypothetical protein
MSIIEDYVFIAQRAKELEAEKPKPAEDAPATISTESPTIKGWPWGIGPEA